MEKIQEKRLRIIYKDYDSSHDKLLAMTNSTFQDYESFCLRYTKPYTKCTNGLFEVKPTNYSLRNLVKLVQPNETDIGLWPTISSINNFTYV